MTRGEGCCCCHVYLGIEDVAGGGADVLGETYDVLPIVHLQLGQENHQLVVIVHLGSGRDTSHTHTHSDVKLHVGKVKQPIIALILILDILNYGTS